MAVAAPAAPSVAAATDNETHVVYLTRNTQACVLRPFCFFVSWQGVLTLAYRGFPAPLVALKQQITDYYQGLPKESPGSKWPKTSLASLKEGRRLTPDQLQRLNDLCRSVFPSVSDALQNGLQRGVACQWAAASIPPTSVALLLPWDWGNVGKLFLLRLLSLTALK